MDILRLQESARRHGVVLLLQHGSTVHGTAHRASDVDLAALFDSENEITRRYWELSSELQSLASGRDVDVVLLNHADPLLLKKVTERCHLIYGPASRLHELTLYAYKRYQDHRRFLAMEREYVRRKLAPSTR